MSAKLAKLSQSLTEVLGDRISAPVVALGEVTIEVSAANYADVMRTLCDNEAFCVSSSLLICVVSIIRLTPATKACATPLSCTLLSLKHNWRLRVRCFCVLMSAFPDGYVDDQYLD